MKHKHSEQTHVYHDDFFFSRSGHGDNVLGGTAQRWGWLNKCNQLLFVTLDFQNQKKQVIWLVMIHSNNILCSHCMFDHPLMQIRFSVGFASPFFCTYDFSDGSPQVDLAPSFYKCKTLLFVFWGL